LSAANYHRKIKRIELTRRAGGRPVLRYQLTVDVGIVDGKRKQLRKRYANEQEARKVLDEIRGDVARGTYVHVTELTVDNAIEDWLLSHHGIKAKSKSGYAGVLAPVRSELGHLSVQKLTRRDIDGLIQRLRDGSVARAKGEGRRRKWGARSCNYMLVALSQVFKPLAKDGTVMRNIVEDVDRVPGKPKKFATYTPAQVECVLRAIRKDRNRHAWHLALCGLRRGEIGGLRWTNVDLEARTLAIGPTRISVDGKAIEQDDAKSEDSERTLPIPDPLRAELKAARKRHGGAARTGYRLSRRWLRRVQRGRQALPPRHAVQDVDQGGRRRGRATHPAARRAAHLRHHHAPARRPARGDRSVARPRRRDVHDAHLRALPARRARRGRAQFGADCDNS